MSRDGWVLSTKVGRLLRPRTQDPATEPYRHPLPFNTAFDYTYDGVMRAFEDSLQRLGLARIDVLYAHDIGAGQHKEVHPKVMRKFRDGGERAPQKSRHARALR